MKHHTTKSFWQHYESLPLQIRKIADKNFELLKHNPHHPSLQLKKIQILWSVRVGLNYRALAMEEHDGVYWFWIGTHDEYERLIASF